MTNSSGSREFLSVRVVFLIVAVFVAGVVIGLVVSVAAWVNALTPYKARGVEERWEQYIRQEGPVGLSSQPSAEFFD